MSRFAGGVFLLLLLASRLHANEARDLYQAGKYDQAIAAASAENSASGFALAARATLADAMTRKPCLECLKRAEAFARKAVAADSKLPDGHIYLAVALGYQAHIIGLVRARLAGDAEEAKANLDAALASDPQNVWAMAALGGWNIEIVRGGGPVLASWLYGANVKAGLDFFARAFKAAPDNIVLRYQYALSLSGYDLDTYRAEVSEALARASTGGTNSAYDNFAQSRARELLASLKAGDVTAYRDLVRRDQGYP